MRPTLRVALLATVVEFGGIERVLLTLLQHMDPGIELFPVLFTRTEAKVKGNCFFNGLEVLNVPYDTIYVNTSRYKYFNPLRNINEAITCFKVRQFDLIHTHGYRADVIGLIISKYFKLPIVSTCHGFISTDRRLSFYNGLDVFLLRYFNRIIAVSEQMKRNLAEKGVDEEQIQVITNAVWNGSRPDTTGIRRKTRSRMGIREEEFVFGFVGRLSEEKGLGYLVEALKRQSQKDNLWRLVLLGDGPQRGMLEQAVRDFGLADKVLFTGFQSDTTAWYPAIDAFVLPSLTEGTPMALLEAMANGIPVIATSVGGIPALLSSGENGILVPPADPVRLQEAMRSVADNRDLRSRLSIGAIRSVRQNHDVSKWIKKVSEVYRATLRQSRGI